MKRFRALILAAMTAIAWLLPFSEFGELGIEFIAPALFGILVAGLFFEESLVFRWALLIDLVTGVAAARNCWIVAVGEGDCWSFRGEWGFLAASAATQLFSATLTFVATPPILRRILENYSLFSRVFDVAADRSYWFFKVGTLRMALMIGGVSLVLPRWPGVMASIDFDCRHVMGMSEMQVREFLGPPLRQRKGPALPSGRPIPMDQARLYYDYDWVYYLNALGHLQFRVQFSADGVATGYETVGYARAHGEFIF